MDPRRPAAVATAIGTAANVPLWLAADRLWEERELFLALVMADIRAADPDGAETPTREDKAQQILRRLALRRTNADIAREMGFTEETAETYAKRLLAVLGARNRDMFAAGFGLFLCLRLEVPLPPEEAYRHVRHVWQVVDSRSGMDEGGPGLLPFELVRRSNWEEGGYP